MSPPLNWHKWLVLSLLGLALSAWPIACDYSSITEKFGAEAVARCNEKCPFQNRTADGHFDVNCGSDCSVQQCRLGCSLWQLGLKNSCQNVCNVTSETVFSRELYCVMGCNEALNTYFQKLRELIGTPSAPALVADSLTARSLSLVWEAPGVANLSHLVQWRYEELPGTWQYYSNASHADRSIIHVDNLRPYTKYRFRVAIFLSGRVSSGEPVYSAPSVVISTLESGKPDSPPVALRAAAPDPSRVAISWQPGPFPNGPLISYVLRLADTQPNTNDALEDMPASNKTLFYMFQNLAPAREYEVSVSMRNAVGEGPRAYVRISTPPLPKSVPSQQPILILGGERNILAAPANDILADPIELYTTNETITGVGLDISSDSLFVSVSSGYVYRNSLSKRSISHAIITPKNTYKPLDLSVDWLNRHLYILGEVHYTRDGSLSNSSLYSTWEIIRCDFEGRNQIVALSGFNSRPIHFEVDAYNGYLFWALRGVEHGGLYRLDLANISNGVPHNATLKCIVKDAHLGAFTVDHADFRLLVAHLRRNTVLAVSLDGREVSDFRPNTQTPMFSSVRSIAYASGLFYWTNGREMLIEEYHAKSDSYFHNEYPLAFNTKVVATSQVLVALRSCQPIPVPVNPPLGVQGVMGIDRAKVSWSPPHLLGHQGNGAWQQWTFHLQLTHMDTGETINIKNINESMYVAKNLKQDTEYVIKVAAETESGSGPWSSEFIGKTLASTPTTLHSTLLWSGPDGLLQTDLTGDNMKTLIHSSHLKNLYITDISWYRDVVYLVTNASTVMWYNCTSNARGLLPALDNVASLAVDWVGHKIYWSNPKQQLISRGNFDGSGREPVPIVTVAKELTIDSLAAYIYWSTGHAVEAARLNGENRIIYYPAQLFSGKQVMGLTADLEKKWLYWLVRSYDGSELHRAPTADKISTGISEVSGSLVSRLSGTATLGPLCYFSGRLVWVADAARAVVSDLAGRYTADLMPRVHVIAVRDPTVHAQSEYIIAIPETINASSIAIVGSWERFNVTWAPARRVNLQHAKVFYDVSLLFEGQFKIERTVEVPWVEVHGERCPRPYSAAEVTVRAYTHWGGGVAARAHTRSPPAAPAPPTAPALYVQPAHSGGPLTAVFRWKAPSRANGVIRQYEVQCWSQPAAINSSASSALATSPPPKSSACPAAILPPLHTQIMLRDLMPNSIYFFRVRAYTDAGYGEFSEIISAPSDEINPIPKVMLSSQESIKIFDLDSGESEIIPKSTGKPVDFVVSTEENVVYWVNNLEEIFSSRINGSGHYKLTSINASATSICADWVGRAVYWSQHEVTATESYVVYRASLGIPNTRPQIARLFARKQPIYGLQIAPLHGSLYWYEENNHPGLGTLMTSRINGSHIRTFFSNHDEAPHLRGNCNCPENPQVAKTFTLDMAKDDIELYWVDPWVHQIVSTDMSACKCRVVVDASKKRYGFTPMAITVDSKYIYWFNSTEKSIYYTNKLTKSEIEQVKAFYGYKIMTLDPATQPYPPRQCLFPKAHNLHPTVISNSANSLTLQMPKVGKPKYCHQYNYEMAAIEYTVYYRLKTSNKPIFCDKKTCPYKITTSSEVILNELSPFTNYTVMLEATNYYAKLHEVAPIVGTPMVLQTAAEAPTAPKDVKATVLSPVLARVTWTPDPGLWYELHWGTDDSSSLPLKEHNTFEVSEGGSANMTRLSPDTRYSVWVRARSAHSSRAGDSPALRLRTYPLPAPLALRNATAYALRVVWTPPTAYNLHHYSVEYSEAMPKGAWRACERVAGGEWRAGDLRPRTRYRFRLRLQYVPQAPHFYWPNEDIFTYETLGDVPGPPGPLRVQAVGDKVLRAWWAEPDPKGYPVTEYRVWGRPQHIDTTTEEISVKNYSELLPANLPSDIDDDMKIRIIREGLELLHNGTESYWLIGAGEVSAGYVAHVQARNQHGWGALSAGAVLSGAPLAAAPRPHPAALAAALAAIAALALAVPALLLYTYKNRNKKKAALEAQMNTLTARRGPDVELATLRQLPIRHSNNILYNQGAASPTEAEIAALPHVRRDHITLNKFLGSGAFGEVFEGVARLNNGTGDTKVAVKTLRKGATEQEKAEFLKEAALMSNFKHEHILRLLGVCLDNDPHYILMELMEAGDLLSYLRAKRPSLYTPESLTLLDLLNMCVDVTKGCRYLEEMHFVHRDLAARNCLVSHRAAGRLVKIGDFGLARDIYKNDYYRKEGEGLLPVRWMAVECLVDGIFSCQSDVWAWGVLCWEILSLGQQPYPARTNRQVLDYVRAGGTPDRPPNCPPALYELLQQCWSYNAEARPTFAQCLALVTSLRDAAPPHAPLAAQPQPQPHYLTLLADDAVDNRTYLLDENQNACVDEDFPEAQMEPSRLLPQHTPKYLELMYDSDSGADTLDGYEVPRTPTVYTPFSRHSIVGVAPNRLIKPPLYRRHSLRAPPLRPHALRTQSLRANTRPPNATIIPLRNGIMKRASLCETDPRPGSSHDFDKHIFKTLF
ncbi:proto-oncogene tyrosine-protein kinase ROS isoform X1 [Papilio machaon]|uniref:proto-oncogene tyrosine-protein kinase ROS isoform X1 n=1 Tax=Papilio machaon TaxID=76193 RepID=UPI001E663F3E|nr:proto-oncogene tyrosine-protein kinase ROS isoform X1 [Papilio machaon]